MIHKLTLENFRSHKRSEIALDRLTVIRGPHGAGKTSVLLALQYLLTGKCEMTDEAGRGAESLIRDGAKELRITAHQSFDGSAEETGTITRNRNRAGGGLLIQPPDFLSSDLVGKEAEAWLAEHIGAPAILAAVLSTSRFLEMKPKDQKDLLTAALPAARVKVPADVVESQVYCGFSRNEVISSAAQADEIHGLHYDQRTELNRAAKLLRGAEAPAKPEGLPRGLTLEDSETQIRNLYLRRDKIVGDRVETLGAHNRKADQLRLAEGQLKLYESQILGDTDIKVFEAVIAKSETIGKLSGEVEKLRETIHSNRLKVAMLRSAKKNCPTCGHAIDNTESERQAGLVEAQLATDEATLAAKNAQLLRLGDLETAKDKMAAHKKAIAATAASQKVVEELAGLPASVDLSGFDRDLAQVDQDLAVAGGHDAALRAYAGAEAQYSKQTERLKETEGELVHVERVIAAFAPSGPLRTQLVGDRFDEFRQRLLGCLERFRFGCTLSLEPYEFRVTCTPNGPDRAIGELSGAEAFQFGVAFQIALAEATGAPLVVIDRSDTLLPSLRPLLTALALSSTVPQVIVLSAGERLARGVPAMSAADLPAGVRFIDLDNTEGQTVIAASVCGQPKETEYVPAE